MPLGWQLGLLFQAWVFGGAHSAQLLETCKWCLAPQSYGKLS